jgi:5-methylthioadenosine/S-adenosylhomocysteine deaminase
MQSVDTILIGGTVITMDESYSIFNKGAVVIQGDSIIDVGESDNILSLYQATEVVDCTGMAIMPGLINAHTHAPMTLLRGLADDLRLDVWLMGYIMPTEREFVNPEFVHLGTSLACAEMIRSGVTTFCDMYYFEDSVASATADAGLRAICGQTILKFPSPDAQSYEESLEACRNFIMDWQDHPLITPAVAPHAPYTATDEILRACAALAVEFDVPIHIHIGETALEVEQHRAQYDMPIIPWIKKQNLFDAKVIAAHCVHLDTGEMHTIRRHNVGVVHNPTSNLKLASGIAPIGRMLELGLNVGVGTDGTASNNDLDMFEETRLAALLAKTASDDPTTLPAKQALAMATNLGARAIHLDNLTGSLEPGKRADITVVDLRRLHNWPHFARDPEAIYSQVIYAAKSTDVAHVMCNGQWLLKIGELLTLNPETLYEQAADVARRIDTFLIEREGDTLSKLLALGELQQEESFEVQVKAQLNSLEQGKQLLDHPEVNIVTHTHYQQYDTYFVFADQMLRYREDLSLLGSSSVPSVRTRLTLTGEREEFLLQGAILLSRSRFIAQATHPLRFYREYFQSEKEHNITKERRRWHLDYKGLRLYLNLDQLIEPEHEGYYIEIKSRTWSRRDAEKKANAISELLAYLEIEEAALIKEEYVRFTTK